VKISKRQLKRIIREEKRKIIEAQYPNDLQDTIDKLFNILHNMAPEERILEINTLIDDLEFFESKG